MTAKTPMEKRQAHKSLLKRLPKVDRLLEMAATHAGLQNAPRTLQVRCIRTVLDELRRRILAAESPADAADFSPEKILAAARELVADAMQPNLIRCVNATGVVVHTNLGRSLLAPAALKNMHHIGAHYSNLEFDLDEGRRGSRYRAVEDLLCEISGAQAAMAVNNNAAAVLLCLETLARGRNVIVSRGELVEIGGSFRIPDVMTKSGANLKEVGTTNRTHLKDYRGAIDDDTGLLLKVHASNYRIVGFTAEVSLDQLVELGRSRDLPVMQDLGSGSFIDFSAYGLAAEPTVQASVQTGADVITFSGDKLLGGPQAGIIVGRRDILARIQQNPLTRALRIDKLTLAALESTLRLYRDPRRACEQLPTLRMITSPYESIAARARELASRLENLGAHLHIKLLDRPSRAGGGALPTLDLPSCCVAIGIAGRSAQHINHALRHSNPPVIGRLEEDFFLMDMRTVQNDEIDLIVTAVGALLQEVAR